MISSAGLIKFNCPSTENLFGLFNRYTNTNYDLCALITLSNVGIYRRIFESNLAKKYVVFDENFLAIKHLCDHYNNVEFVEINNKNIKNIFIEKADNMKIDLAIMNPPYGDSIHLEIFDMISDRCNTICVFPFTWCAKHNINLPKGKWREKLQGKIDSVTYYDHRTANDIFGTGNSIEDLAVVTTKPNTKFDLIHYGFKNRKEYDLYKKIDFYTNKGCKTMSSAKNKSGEYGGTAEMFRTMKPKYFVPIYQWHVGKNCFDACVIQDKNKISKGCSYFKFNSEQEQTNFKNSV